MVYALRVDYYERLEIAAIANGAAILPGDQVEQFDQWLESEPEPVDPEKAQLMAALGVGP